MQENAFARNSRMPKRYPGLARHGGKRIGAGRKREVVNREFIRARVRAIRHSPRNGTLERELKILRHIFLNHNDSVGLEAGLALLKLNYPCTDPVDTLR